MNCYLPVIILYGLFFFIISDFSCYMNTRNVLAFPKWTLLESVPRSMYSIFLRMMMNFFRQKRVPRHRIPIDLFTRARRRFPHRDCRRLFSARPAIVLSSWRAQLILAPGTLHSVVEAW